MRPWKESCYAEEGFADGVWNARAAAPPFDSSRKTPIERAPMNLRTKGRLHQQALGPESQEHQFAPNVFTSRQRRRQLPNSPAKTTPEQEGPSRCGVACGFLPSPAPSPGEPLGRSRTKM